MVLEKAVEASTVAVTFEVLMAVAETWKEALVAVAIEELLFAVLAVVLVVMEEIELSLFLLLEKQGVVGEISVEVAELVVMEVEEGRRLEGMVEVLHPAQSLPFVHRRE